MEESRKKNVLTSWIIALTVFVLVAYDIVVYFMKNGPLTLSTTVGHWIAHTAWTLVFMGILIGHLLASTPTSSISFYQFIIFSLALILGYTATQWGS
jgi:hypothetical protein